MKAKLVVLTVFLCFLTCCCAQDSTIVLSASLLEKNFQIIPLGNIDGWIFHLGNDSTWAKNEPGTTGWKDFKPTQLNATFADKNGKAEGWFRLRFRLDSSFRNVAAGLSESGWSQNEVYLDGQRLAPAGSTRYHTKDYRRLQWQQGANLSINPETEHTLAVHFVDHCLPFNSAMLVTQRQELGIQDLVMITGPKTLEKEAGFRKEYSIYATVWISFCGALSLLFWFLFFQNRGEKNLLFIAVTTTGLSAGMLCTIFTSLGEGVAFYPWIVLSVGSDLFFGIATTVGLLLFPKLFHGENSRSFTFFMGFLTVVYVLNPYFFHKSLTAPLALLSTGIALYFILSSWRHLGGAQWAMVIGYFVTCLFNILFSYNWAASHYAFPFPFGYFYVTGLFVSAPLGLLVYVAMRFKEILVEVRENAAHVVQLSEEKKQRAIDQQKILEEEVATQTIELRTSLQNLRSTQAQLIQSEKMASLGELTAGIAHEIQNPLNFVNNFSEVNKELLVEMKDEIKKGNIGEIDAIADDVIENSEKINHHGKRADAIVKGMLQHSKISSGQKELANINALANEYLRLSYHGFRAKDKTFNATIETDFDGDLSSVEGKINIVPQDIGRVLLNLYNNAFYAVNEKKKTVNENYQPKILIQTKKLNNRVEIRVEDNGNGIPKNIVDKIFQPFFTTKPTGQGTGLGLSLSYDIIKAHGGEIKVETKEGEGSDFIIQLPITE